MATRVRRLARAAAIFGAIGGVVCLLSMALAVAGAFGAVTAGSLSEMSMAGMPTTPHSTPGILVGLVRWGPEMLGASVGLIVLTLGLRHQILMLPALLIGAVVYWAMYGRSRVTVMIVLTLAGFGGWTYLFYNSRMGSARNHGRPNR